MPYTLTMGLVWILLAVLLGLVVGWLLRSVAARRQIARARGDVAGSGNEAEIERLRNRVAKLEPVAAERDRLQAELDAAQAAPSAPAPAVGAATAADAIGRPVQTDDLTVVEGIGPEIARRCHGIGITGWADLATTEVSLLRTMLSDAGPSFATHDPSTWPEQAALLAQGSWTEFAALTERLDGGRVGD